MADIPGWDQLYIKKLFCWFYYKNDLYIYMHTFAGD